LDAQRPTLAPPPFPTRRSSDLAALTSVDLFLGSRDTGDQFLASVVPGTGAQSNSHAWQVTASVPDNAGGRDFDLRASRNISFIRDRKSTRLNSSHGSISYAVFC